MFSFFMTYQVDHWLDFANIRVGSSSDFHQAVAYLDKILGPRTFLVGHELTIADFAVWGALKGDSVYIFILGLYCMQWNRYME